MAKKKKPTEDDGLDAELISVLEEDQLSEGQGQEEELPVDELAPFPEDELPQPFGRVPLDPELSEEPPVQEDPELDEPVPLAKPQAELSKIEDTDVDEMGLRKVLSKFADSVDEIILNQKSDREQIDAAIQYLEGQIKQIREEDGKIPAIFIDAWTRLLQSKADVNANASKVLDSIAKMLSAGKGNELVLKLGMVDKGDMDLESLLQQPIYDDEATEAKNNVL